MQRSRNRLRPCRRAAARVRGSRSTLSQVGPNTIRARPAPCPRRALGANHPDTVMRAHIARIRPARHRCHRSGTAQHRPRTAFDAARPAATPRPPWRGPARRPARAHAAPKAASRPRGSRQRSPPDPAPHRGGAAKPPPTFSRASRTPAARATSAQASDIARPGRRIGALRAGMKGHRRREARRRHRRSSSTACPAPRRTWRRNHRPRPPTGSSSRTATSVPRAPPQLGQLARASTELGRRPSATAAAISARDRTGLL